MRAFAFLGLALALLLAGWIARDFFASPIVPSNDSARLIAALERIHTPLGPPQPGDWLLSHDEPGQTFREYLAEDPTIPTAERGVLYILPIGEFTARQQQIVDATAKFLSLYLGVPTKLQEAVSLEVVPERARRVHPSWGMPQILTTFLLDELLLERLPDDAAAYIGLTASDLWPGRGWNFVFGQASLHRRVGVWSMHRNGDPEESDEEYRRCLLRTLKTATHETGHMFSIRHCTAYECNMCGCNNREESDRRPLALCPQCTAKVCWATGSDPYERFVALAEFCREHDLPTEAEFYDESLKAIRDVPRR